MTGRDVVKGAGQIEAERDVVTSVLPTEAVRWQLRLYVAGASPRSLKASANLRRLCDEHLAGRHEIEIVDLIELPLRARADDIIAIPTLVRSMPEPIRKVIGDLSDTKRVMRSLQMDGEGW